MVARVMMVLLLTCLVLASFEGSPALASSSALYQDAVAGFKLAAPSGWSNIPPGDAKLELLGPKVEAVAPRATVALEYSDETPEEFLRAQVRKIEGRLGLQRVSPTQQQGAGGTFMHARMDGKVRDVGLVCEMGVFTQGRRRYLLRFVVPRSQLASLQKDVDGAFETFQVLPRQPAPVALDSPYKGGSAFRIAPPAHWKARPRGPDVQLLGPSEGVAPMLTVEVNDSREPADKFIALQIAEAQRHKSRLVPAGEVAVKSGKVQAYDVPVPDEKPPVKVIYIVTGQPGRILEIKYVADPEQFAVYWPAVQASIATCEAR